MKKFLTILFLIITTCIMGLTLSACGHTHAFNNYVCSCGVEDYTEGLEYERAEDVEGYIVTGLGLAEGENLVIPSKHEGLPVVAISDGVFSGIHHIKTATIIANVVSIGDYAFF